MAVAIASGSSPEDKRNVEREEQNGGHGGQEDWIWEPCEAHSPHWAGLKSCSVIPEQSKIKFLLCDPTLFPAWKSLEHIALSAS